MSKLTNPYPPDEEKAPMSYEIGRSDYNFIRLIRPQMGTITITVNLLWKAFVNELKRRGITDITRVDDFERFLESVVVTDRATIDELLTQSEELQRYKLGAGGGLPHGTADRPATEGSGNDRRGTESVRPGDTTTSGVVSNLPRSNRSRGQRKGRGTEEGNQS